MSSERWWDATNIFVLPATISGNFRYADWRGAARRGVVWVVWEAFKAVVGTTAEPFFVPCRPRRPEWEIGEIRKLLRRHGIELWGVGYYNHELFFRVKARQAHWAQYVLLRAGVPLLHGLLGGARANPGG